MKKQIKSWIGILSLVLILSSCASTAHIEKDDNFNFNHYKTFAWNSNEDKENDLLQKNIRIAVNQELQKAGWSESKGKPDVLLEYDVLIEKSIKEQSNPVYSQPYSRLIYNPYTRRYASVYYPSQFLGYERDEQRIREGTVTITMIESKTDKMVWQGWSTDEVNNKNLTSKEIQNLVKTIFKKADLAKN